MKFEMCFTAAMTFRFLKLSLMALQPLYRVWSHLSCMMIDNNFWTFAQAR